MVDLHADAYDGRGGDREVLSLAVEVQAERGRKVGQPVQRTRSERRPQLDRECCREITRPSTGGREERLVPITPLVGGRRGPHGDVEVVASGRLGLIERGANRLDLFPEPLGGGAVACDLQLRAFHGFSSGTALLEHMIQPLLCGLHVAPSRVGLGSRTGNQLVQRSRVSRDAFALHGVLVEPLDLGGDPVAPLDGNSRGVEGRFQSRLGLVSRGRPCGHPLTREPDGNRGDVGMAQDRDRPEIDGHLVIGELLSQALGKRALVTGLHRYDGEPVMKRIHSIRESLSWHAVGLPPVAMPNADAEGHAPATSTGIWNSFNGWPHLKGAEGGGTRGAKTAYRDPHMAPEQPHQHAQGHGHHDGADWEALATQIELEGELLLAFVTNTAQSIAELRGPDAPPVQRILDIGSGPGVGTCELARRFPDAHVVAVDGSPAMLDRTRHRAADQGLDHRIETHDAELPNGLDDLAPADVIWASMSLHHIGDETNGLRVLRALLKPSGLLAVAERAEPTRVLPDELDVGRPGLADRLDRAESDWFKGMRAGLAGNVPSTDLASMLAAAGFDVVSARIARERHDPPLSDAARQFVVGRIRRARHGLTDLLDEDDRRALDVLSDPDDPRSVLRRPDVLVAASRQIVIARSS